MKFKESDSRATPDWLMRVFNGYFDPCPLNPAPERDGLSIEWKEFNYVNPPYSKPLPWIKKAINESKKGKVVVFLIRFDPTTKWFKLLIENNAHLFYCAERIAFNNPTSKSNYASPFPSILVILSNNRLPQEQKTLRGLTLHK